MYTCPVVWGKSHWRTRVAFTSDLSGNFKLIFGKQKKHLLVLSWFHVSWFGGGRVSRPSSVLLRRFHRRAEAKVKVHFCPLGQRSQQWLFNFSYIFRSDQCPLEFCAEHVAFFGTVDVQFKVSFFLLNVEIFYVTLSCRSRCSDNDTRLISFSSVAFLSLLFLDGF